MFHLVYPEISISTQMFKQLSCASSPVEGWKIVSVINLTDSYKKLKIRLLAQHLKKVLIEAMKDFHCIFGAAQDLTSWVENPLQQTFTLVGFA